MTKKRPQKWNNNPRSYSQEVNAWLDAEDAAHEGAMWERFELGEEVMFDELNQRHVSPRMDIARAISALKSLPAANPKAAEIHAAIRRIAGDRDDLRQYAAGLLQAKRGPGNKSRRPRTRVQKDDPWAQINQLQEAELMDHFAREAIAIYKRIKQRHRQLHFRRSGQDGLPDDLGLAVDRALRIPDQVHAEADATGARKRRGAFREKVLDAARARLRGDAPGVRRRRRSSRALKKQ